MVHSGNPVRRKLIHVEKCDASVYALALCETTLNVSLYCHLKNASTHWPKKYILHIADVCMLTMAATDESCSPATSCTSEELDNTSPVTDAVGKSPEKRKTGRNARIISHSTARSTVTIDSKHKRAKFEPKRRQQVAHVRKKGACLRSRIKKLSVGAGVCFWPEALRLTTTLVFWIAAVRVLPT